MKVPYKHCFANVSHPRPILGRESGKVSFWFIGTSTPGFCIVFLCLSLYSDLRNLGIFLNPDLRFLIIRLQDDIYMNTAIYVAQECSLA